MALLGARELGQLSALNGLEGRRVLAHGLFDVLHQLLGLGRVVEQLLAQLLTGPRRAAFADDALDLLADLVGHRALGWNRAAQIDRTLAHPGQLFRREPLPRHARSPQLVESVCFLLWRQGCNAFRLVNSVRQDRLFAGGMLGRALRPATLCAAARARRRFGFGLGLLHR